LLIRRQRQMCIRDRSNGEVHFGELGASLMKKRFDPLEDVDGCLPNRL
jgi:hypothetical protein